MKTILYNPIFINPQAYYVFPRLTRWLRPDDSYKEPANYIGQIEVTIIAYGEIGYTEYFEHTNYIDFTNFSNSYVRISLFTRLGSCVLGEWKIGAMEGDRPYIEPEVLASLKAVVIVGDKTNQDKDRDIVANLVDASNPFIISNAAYKLNSGYGLYGMDFLDWKSNSGMNFTSTKLTSTKPNLSGGWLTFRNVSGLIPETKVKVSGAPREFVFIGNNNGTDDKFSVTINNGVYTIPEFTLSSASGFYINNNSGDWSNLVIEQIPSYQGAFVTDGVDDLITSTKTVQEMGITDEITVVSMIGQLSTSNVNNYTNTIRNQLGTTGSYNKIAVSAIDKTGIYGYSFDSSLKCSIINDILGDKQDYSVSAATQVENIGAKYLVQGWIDINGLARELSSVAWYWTVIANKVLTTDQINQVIAYYNLDRCVEPTVWYDVQKQGLSNDTPDSDWYLKDFSKNGFDMSLFNFAKKGGSGVAAKQGESTKDWSKIKDEGRQELTIYNEFKYKVKSNEKNNYWSIQYINHSSTSYPITIIADKDCFWSNYINLYDEEGNKQYQKKEIAISANTPTQVLCCGFDEFPDVPEGYHPTSAVTYAFLKEAGELTIEIIPSCKGALCFDGVDDYGKVTGMPVYKDYTVVTDREIFANIGAISSKNNPGAFVETAGNSVYSFGQATSGLNFISTRSISYLSKYSYCGQSITAGAAEDGTDMWLGTIRDNDTRFFNGAIYSLMSFPYSMSEFLIERQLKKHKLGMLYPDMVEFRPIVNSNVEWNIIEIWQADKPLYRPAIGTNETGTYLQKDSTIGIYVKPKGVDEVTKIVVNGTEYTNLKINSNGFYYVTLPITKSPQKINITIDEYIRYEDIVQPYPAFYEFTDEDKNLVTWGSKVKVGTTITRIKAFVDSNLLKDLYTISYPKLNGISSSSSKYVVEKQMVFTCNATYIKGSNAPKCILSPSRLRIPNSSYKILGYIPDISGHGNHGKINNSAYAGMSGANGYTEKTFSEWSTSNKNAELSLANDVKLRITKVTKANLSVIYNQISYYSTDTIQRYKVTGVNESHPIIFGNDMPVNSLLTVTQDGEYEVDWKTYGKNPCIFTNWTGDCNITIEQVGEYEGAYCLDGVDDFITIPTTVGGKQMLMKVNWQSSIGQGMLYDQRGTAFAIWNSNKYNDDETDTIPAYSARNGGNTYIDGILNKNILASQLRNITHNIVATNTMLNGSSVSPTIGCRTEHDAYFTNMSLYDFMLFDEIDSDEEILTLNEYVGIEGNTDDLFN